MVQCVPSLIPSPMKALRRQWYFYHRAYNRVWAHFSCIWNRKHLEISVYDISNYLQPKKQSTKLWRWISLFFGDGGQGERQWLYFPKLFIKNKACWNTDFSLRGMLVLGVHLSRRATAVHVAGSCSTAQHCVRQTTEEWHHGFLFTQNNLQPHSLWTPSALRLLGTIFHSL